MGGISVVYGSDRISNPLVYDKNEVVVNSEVRSVGIASSHRLWVTSVVQD